MRILKQCVNYNPFYNDINIDLSQIKVNLTDTIDPERPIMIKSIGSKINLLEWVHVKDPIPLEIENSSSND